MSTFATFVLGLLTGWIVEWVIDWIYWRKRTQNLQDENNQLHSRLAKAEERYQGLEQQPAEQVPVPAAAALQDENDRLRGQLAQAESRIKDLEGQPMDAVPAAAGAGQAEADQLRSQLAQADERIKQLESQLADQVPAPAAPERWAGVETGAGAAAGQSAPLPVEKDDLIIIKGIGPVIAGKLGQAGIHTYDQLAQLTADQLRAIEGDSISHLADEDDIIAQARQLAAQKRSRE